MELRIEQLGKRFQQGWIFRDLSYHFHQNGCYGIAGRNGSGKSTLLKILSGLLSPSAGEVIYQRAGCEILREHIYTEVNVAAPYVELIEEYSLEEMVRFHIQFKGGQDPIIPDHWIDKMQLNPVRKRTLSQFSSGMKQRVKLGLALYSPGTLLFLDEPTSNLDENAKEWFYGELQNELSKKLIFIASNEAQDFQYTQQVVDLNK
jgi:ABC-type multidrug transport system ATPase subunit